MTKAKTTAVFCEYIDKIWNNVTSKDEYSSDNDSVLEKFIRICKDTAELNGGRPKFLSLYAFQLTVKSIVDLNNYLTQHVNSSIKLTVSNLTQDALENLFSQFRSCGNLPPPSLIGAKHLR